MASSYVRRFRMEYDLQGSVIPAPTLPDGYVWRAWEQALLDEHVAVKYASFHEEIDAQVFPCLADLAGCKRLMNEIVQQKAFVPQATWLVAHQCDPDGFSAGCGTIQGLAQNAKVGAVQNVGVVPEHRGLGLGRALVLQALHGFRAAGLRRIYLEVTAHNRPAVELYRGLGFRLTRTMYKALDAQPVAST